MPGGAGNDTYFVDNAVTPIIETPGEGTDFVFSSVNYAFTANIELSLLHGAGNSDGAGNNAANAIFGNSGANIIDGAAVADSLTGNAGNDIFLFRAGQASGDLVADHTGNGSASGEKLSVPRLRHGGRRGDLHADRRHHPVADPLRAPRPQRGHHATETVQR